MSAVLNNKINFKNPLITEIKTSDIQSSFSVGLTPKNVSDSGKPIHTTEKLDLWRYSSALGDAVLHMKPAERQSFQMTKAGRQTRYESGESEYHYFNCILVFLPRAPGGTLVSRYLPSSVLIRSLFPPWEEVSFAFLAPRAKFHSDLLTCVI